MLRGARACLLSAATGCGAALAGEIVAEVTDARGTPVADAVVYATPLAGKIPHRPAQAMIAHENKQFVPLVTAVQTGSTVNIPNRDKVKHHAYSVSPAKPFELPLYSGSPEAPVVFDQPGVVTIGCNIHDWMVAYVCVLETPFFAVTGADGRARLTGLAGGAHRVEAWQPRLIGSPAHHAQQVAVDAGKPAQTAFKLNLKPDFRPRRTPAASEGGYR